MDDNKRANNREFRAELCAMEQALKAILDIDQGSRFNSIDEMCEFLRPHFVTFGWHFFDFGMSYSHFFRRPANNAPANYTANAEFISKRVELHKFNEKASKVNDALDHIRSLVRYTDRSESIKEWRNVLRSDRLILLQDIAEQEYYDAYAMKDELKQVELALTFFDNILTSIGYKRGAAEETTLCKRAARRAGIKDPDSDWDM